MAKMGKLPIRNGKFYYYETSKTRFEAFQVVVVVKNPPANAGDVRDAGSIWGQEDLLEEGMTIHSSTLAWRIPWTEEPGRL